MKSKHTVKRVEGGKFVQRGGGKINTLTRKSDNKLANKKNDDKSKTNLKRENGTSNNLNSVSILTIVELL